MHRMTSLPPARYWWMWVARLNRSLLKTGICNLAANCRPTVVLPLAGGPVMTRTTGRGCVSTGVQRSRCFYVGFGATIPGRNPEWVMDEGPIMMRAAEAWPSLRVPGAGTPTAVDRSPAAA
jgi:hypothetical protein